MESQKLQHVEHATPRPSTLVHLDHATVRRPDLLHAGRVHFCQGAKIFRNAELVFQFNTAMRFTDKTLIQILEAMRTPGGRKLSPAQWQALVDTERSAEQPADDSKYR